MLSARKKTSKAQERKARKKRIAQCEIRFTAVKIKSRSKKEAPIDLWIVQVKEKEPPKDDAPICWTLLTSIKISDDQMAEKIVKYYAQR